MRQFIIPYLMFEDSMEVAKYYEKVLGAEIGEIMHGKDVPESSEAEFGKVFHLELKIKDQYIYLFDGKGKPNNQTTLLLDYKDLSELEEAYEKMSSSGEVIQELSDVFWNAKYAVVKDKYGQVWNFHYMKPKN